MAYSPPVTQIRVLAYDNMQGLTPIDTVSSSGQPLHFSYGIPAYSSLSFLIELLASAIGSVPIIYRIFLKDDFFRETTFR